MPCKPLYQRILRCASCLLILLGLAPAVQANERVLIVNSSRDSLYQDYAETLRTYITLLRQDRYTPVITDLNRALSQEDLNRYKLVITAGLSAAEHYLARDMNTPLLVTFIPSAAYHAQKDSRYMCRPRQCHVLFLDQPPARQIKLIRLLLPQHGRLGVFDMHDQQGLLTEYQQAARRQRVSLVPIAVPDSEHVVDALQKSIDSIDVLLAHPDTRLYNRNTAKGILLTTYYNRIPLLAYSSSFVNAGAMVGLYSRPDELARHAAETAVQILENQRPPQQAYPKYFNVEINYRVSESLDLNLPPVATIMERLKHDDAQ